MNPTPSSLSALIDRLTELEAKATDAPWKSEFDRCEPVNEWGSDVLEENDEQSLEVKRAIEDGQVISYDTLEICDIIPEVRSQDARLLVELRNNCKTLLALSRWSLEARESLEVVKMSDIAELSRSEAADALARFPLPHAQ